MAQQVTELLPVNEPIKVTEEQFKKVKADYDHVVFFREFNGEHFIKIVTYKFNVLKEITNIIKPA